MSIGEQMLKIYAFSDTHNLHDKIIVPECDVLIHAGDSTGLGSMQEIIPFLDWYSKQSARYKVLISGNHDWGFEKQPDFYRLACSERGITLLNDELVEIEGLKIYGSPIQPYFCNWAFNRFPGEDIQKHWDRIQKCDVLVTHGPPYGILDETPRGDWAGCRQLLNKILELKIPVHIFGHIHDNNGVKEFMGTKFYNVACCDEKYVCSYQPMEIML